jgi:hypothetical protein
MIMTYEDEKFGAVENVGFVDGVVRGSVSIAILVAIMLIPAISSLTLFALTQLAIYAGLTAFIGWDPVYAMMKQRESRRPAQQSSAAVASYPQRDLQADSKAHKRAA